MRGRSRKFETRRRYGKNDHVRRTRRKMLELDGVENGGFFRAEISGGIAHARAKSGTPRRDNRITEFNRQLRG